MEFDDDDSADDAQGELGLEAPEPLLEREITSFELSSEILEVCKTEGVKTLGDLYELSAQSLVATDFSWEQVKVLRDLMKSQGLRRRQIVPLTTAEQRFVSARVGNEWLRVQTKFKVAEKRDFHQENSEYYPYLLSRDPLIRAFGRSMLVIINQPLAISYAKDRFHYVCNSLDGAHSLDDLVSELHMAIMRAVEDFDPRMGFQFTTYAYGWMKQTLTRYIDEGDLFRIPTGLQYRIRVLGSAQNHAIPGTATSEIFAIVQKKLGLSADSVKALAQKSQDVKKLKNLHRLDDSRSRGEDTRNPHEYIQEADTEDSETVLVAKVSAKKNRSILVNALAHSGLKPRNQEIMRLRFGLSGRDPMTLEEIGNIFDITREAVRQVEVKGLRKLALNPDLSGGQNVAVTQSEIYDIAYPLPFWMTRVEYLFYLTGGKDFVIEELRDPAVIRPDWPFAWPMEDQDDLIRLLVSSRAVLNQVSDGVFTWKMVPRAWQDQIRHWIGSSQERALRAEYQQIAAHIRSCG